MILRVIIITSSLILIYSPVFAEYNRYRLPVGERVSYKNKAYQGYTLEEMKILLKMDNDLYFYERRSNDYLKLVQKKSEVIDKLIEKLAVKDNIIQLEQNDKKRLYEKWVEENRLRHISENKVPISSWISWGSAGVFAIAATVLAILFSIEKKK